MTRIYFLTAFIALAALAFAEPKIDNVDVRIIEDISTFRAENPELSFVPTKGEVRYTVGARVAGDRIVEQTSNNFTFPEHQNVQLNLNYPRSGTGAIVSFVEVFVSHDSNDGGISVVSGGIGTRQISVIVKAKRASFLTYRASIYGY